jgi:hypothetical protein
MKKIVVRSKKKKKKKRKITKTPFPFPVSFVFFEERKGKSYYHEKNSSEE